MFLAKSAVPCWEPGFFKFAALQRLDESPFTWITAPPGYLAPGHLSSVLGDKGVPILWLRTGPEDRDPATLLLSLIYAGKSFDQHFGEETIDQVQRRPGCVYGWPVHFEKLGAELARLLPHSCAFVLENIHQVGEDCTAWKLARSHFLDQMQPLTARVLMSHTEFSPGVMRSCGNVIGVQDLKLRVDEKLPLDACEGTQLPKDDITRILQLAQGRSEVLSAVLSTCKQSGGHQIQRILHESKTLHQLLVQVGRNCLDMAAHQELLTLSLALILGYFQGEIFEEITGKVSMPPGPWLQPLSNGWIRIHEVWRPALETILRRYLETQEEAVSLAANKLASLGAVEIAVPLYLRICRYEQAGMVIQSQLQELMNFGQWETLDGWLRQLPRNIISAFPEILYAQGEIQAFYGLRGKARSSFAQAGSLFSQRGDPVNTCRSLLAESTMAAREGDKRDAFTSAQVAQTISSDAAMNQERAWSDWQYGVLVSLDGQPEYARTQFQNACQLTNDPYTREIFQQALIYMQEMDQTGLQQEYHRHKAQQAGQTRQEVFHRLLKLFQTTPEALPDLLKHYGWLAVPLIFKLPVQTTEENAPAPKPFDRLVHRFKTKVRVVFHWERASNIPTSLSPVNLLAPLHFSVPDNDKAPTSSSPSLSLEKSLTRAAEKTPKADPGIMIYCLGPLRVLNNGQFITNWPSHKAQLVFKYLLLHHSTLVHKETLMDIFWPEADVEAARRNLHQAIYNLRLSLRDIEGDQQIIEFAQDGYRINPSLPIWIDYTVFEQHYKTARQREEAGFLEQAMSDYSLAEEMYMDHLFSEDLYEDWIRSQREYLWQIYLSAATWLAEYHFQKGNYSPAISIGQRVLQKDPCEETAHQVLMRCFHHQGQRQLAIRQYEICRQALREELDVEPSNATRQFFSKVLSE